MILAPSPCQQRGQAIVLLALMLAVLIGMAALAVDGSRAYGLRRDLQNALDSAALAAADKFQQGGVYSDAEQTAVSVFGINSRLYSAPSCTAFGAPGPNPITVRCTYSDGTLLGQTITYLGPGGSLFSLAASRPLALQFARVLTSVTTLTVGAAATGSINNLVYQPVVAALNQSGCGGVGGSAISINSGGTLNVVGDVVSNGSISITSTTMKAAGDIYARCQSAVSGTSSACYPSGASPPCTYPDVVGVTRSGFHLVDPNYPPPPESGTSRPRPSDTVVLSPGTFPADPLIGTGRCYFLSAGVYGFPAGYTANGGFVSNELKPPDEPKVNNNQQVSNAQFWNSNGVNCAGSFQVTVSGSGGPEMGTWGVELTSVRVDSYAGVPHLRESAPSRCQSFMVQTTQTVHLQISNVPGAQSYNIYLSASSCAGPFGLVGALPVQGSVSNQDTSGCPFGNQNNGNNGNGNGNGNGNEGNQCTLGSESISYPAVALPNLPLPNLFAPADTPGAYPPAGETAPVRAGLPNQNPDRANPPAGDRANENQCASSGGVLTACPGAVTPGGVAVVIPSGGCLNERNSSDTYIFSGQQYNWMAIYEPGPGNPPANLCANRMGASSNSAAIGLTYLPSAAVTVTSRDAFDSEGMGGLISGQIMFTASPAIVFSSAYAPVPPASRLAS